MSAAGVAAAGPAGKDADGANPFGTRNCLTYGLLGLPLAFVALPLYVILPNHYAITRASSACRWPRWARCCSARASLTR